MKIVPMKIANWLAGLAVLAPLAGTAAPNQAIEEGTVIWKDHRCAFFIVQTPSGYTLFEWMSGPRPGDGDKIEGPLEGFGPRNVVNKTAQDQVTLCLHRSPFDQQEVGGQQFPASAGAAKTSSPNWSGRPPARRPLCRSRCPSR